MSVLKTFKVKETPLSGSSYNEVCKKSRNLFGIAKGKSKRKFYIRSAYFKKQKVFFDYFWPHLLEKRQADRMRRLKFLPCAFELISGSTYQPEETVNEENGKRETLYRFYGRTSDNKQFVVQMKKSGSKNTLQCISVFPIK